jgi:hypothetical protein
MRTFETVNFTLRLLGLSRDLRTNSWEAVSKCCKKSYKPATTMFSTQKLACPECKKTEVVDYNKLI